MYPKPWKIVFFFILLAGLLVIGFNVPYARFVTKPLLMISLGCYAWVLAQHISNPLRNLIFVALIFSWWGDVLLLFDHFFIAGLISFLLAHLLYTAFFLRVKPRAKISAKEWGFMGLVIVYAILLVFRLMPSLGSLAPAVVIYAAVITIMLLSAIRAFGLYGIQAERSCVAGAILFVASDSMLAIARFQGAFTGSGILVMLTYGLAQWMIVEGAMKYLKTTK